MSIDYELEIERRGDGERIIYLTVNNPAVKLERRPFLRQPFPIVADDIKEMRGGRPRDPLVQKIATDISKWLLSTDLKGYLDMGINLGGNDTVRLVFRVDETLLIELADVPVELLRIEDNWLMTLPKVSGIVHLLGNAPSAADLSPYQDWPLRVLVVRSSPTALRVEVPRAAPVCSRIIQLAEELGRNRVEIDLLSSEAVALDANKDWQTFWQPHEEALKVKLSRQPNLTDAQRAEALRNQEWKEFREHLVNRKIEALDAPTWDNLQRYLQRPYHILVFLGHGDLQSDFPGMPKVGALQMEEPDGRGVRVIRSEQLKAVLQKATIPVVCLAGCLTAAEFDQLEDELRDAVGKSLPDWSIGSQGVAQALVSSSAARVQFAVGMRYQLEANDAIRFLDAFFESLLKNPLPGQPDNRGNVEAAVRAGRWKLFANSPYPPSWSAPMIFRTVGVQEPMFHFIADPPKAYELTREDLRDQEMREKTWEKLREAPNNEFAHDFLKGLENDIRERTLKKGALLMPELVKAKPGDALSLPIKLYGELNVDSLKCQLRVTGEGASISSLRSTQELKDSGYGLADLSEGGSKEIAFTISRTAGNADMAQGAIAIANLDLAQASPAFSLVSLNVNDMQPKKVIRTANNIVLVSP